MGIKYQSQSKFYTAFAKLYIPYALFFIVNLPPFNGPCTISIVSSNLKSIFFASSLSDTRCA